MEVTTKLRTTRVLSNWGIVRIKLMSEWFQHHFLSLSSGFNTTTHNYGLGSTRLPAFTFV